MWSPAKPGKDRADEDAECGAAELVVEGHEVAKPMRDGEDPLPHRQFAENVVHEMSGALIHAPAGATGAPAAPLAGKWHEALEVAPVASEPGEASGGMAARDELAKLPLHESGDASAIGTLADVVEKALELRPHDLVQATLLRTAGPVGRCRS